MIDLHASAIRAFLPSQDFEQSRDFYVALGCAVKYEDHNLALLDLNGNAFYLQRGYAREWAENSMLHITVADARACHEQIAALLQGGQFGAARVASPKQESYGALVTYVWDPCGVLLHLAEWQ